MKLKPSDILIANRRISSAVVSDNYRLLRVGQSNGCWAFYRYIESYRNRGEHRLTNRNNNLSQVSLKEFTKARIIWRGTEDITVIVE